MLNELDKCLLPASIRTLIDAVGVEIAMAVVRAYGGRPLYIPSTPSPSLISTLGIGAAEALCRHYGNEFWGQVPKCQRALIAARNAAWRREYLAGKSQIQIAAESGFTWQAVHRAIHQSAPANDPRQNELEL